MKQLTDEKQLYEVVKTCLPSGYSLKPRFGHTRNEDNSQNTVEVVTNTISIFFKSANKPVRVASGRYVLNSRRVIFNLYTDKANSNSVELGYEILDKIKTNMNSLIGTVTTVDNQNILIKDCEVLIDNNYIGLTEQGLAAFSLELKLVY